MDATRKPMKCLLAAPIGSGTQRALLSVASHGLCKDRELHPGAHQRTNEPAFGSRKRAPRISLCQRNKALQRAKGRKMRGQKRWMLKWADSAAQSARATQLALDAGDARVALSGGEGGSLCAVAPLNDLQRACILQRTHNRTNMALDPDVGIADELAREEEEYAASQIVLATLRASRETHGRALSVMHTNT